jgi:iron complex outermembrane receptor protein
MTRKRFLGGLLGIQKMLLGGVGAFALCASTTAAAAYAAQTFALSIPAESLADALTDLAHQSGLQLLFSSRLVAGLRGPALKGSLSVEDALGKLLLNTNLHFEFVNAHTITILEGPPATPAPGGTASENRSRADGGADTTEGGSPTMTNKREESSMTHRGLMARVFGAFVACGSVIHSGGACAQEASAQGSEASGLEEVVVTAQRREENAQSVPITIDTYSEKQLSDLQITSTLQLMDFTPGLNITRANAAAVPFLRGVGNFNAALGAEATVATFVDDVYRPGVGASVLGFNNVQQVAVLYGPQGTLFGRNAAGGVISVTTKDPTSTPQLNAEVGYANYDTVTGNFYAAGGLGSNVAADLAVDVSNQGTGWGTNLYSDTGAYLSNETSLRSKWIFTPDEADKITLIGFYDKLRNDQGWAQALYPGFVQIDGYSHVGGFYDLDTNYDGHGININDGLSLKEDHKFDAFDLISISAYSTSNWQGNIENDASPANLQQSHLNSEEETWQQEFRVVSAPGSKITWTGGVYLFVDSSQPDPNLKIGTSVGSLANYPNLEQIVIDTQDTTSYAAYGQATIPFGDTTHLTLGARYTDDERRFHGEVLNDLGVVKQTNTSPPSVQKENNGSPTYRVAFDHNFSADTLAYASYNRGFKSGNFNTGGITQPATLPETVDAYEVGFKSDITRTLRVNLAAFLTKIDNLQVLQQTITGPINTNAGAADYKGVDLSILSSPVKNLTLTLSGEYLDAYYSSYDNVLFYYPNTNGEGMHSLVVNNADGYTLPYAQKFSLSTTARYVVNASSGDYAFVTGWAYHDTFTFDTQGLTTQPTYWMANASLTWTSLSKRWDMQLWGDNLLNEKLYAQRQVQAVGYTYSAAAPLTFGVKFGYHLK